MTDTEGALRDGLLALEETHWSATPLRRAPGRGGRMLVRVALAVTTLRRIHPAGSTRSRRPAIQTTRADRMRPDPDLDPIIQAWLAEGPDALAERVLETTQGRIRRSPQQQRVQARSPVSLLLSSGAVAAMLVVFVSGALLVSRLTPQTGGTYSPDPVTALPSAHSSGTWGDAAPAPPAATSQTGDDFPRPATGTGSTPVVPTHTPAPPGASTDPIGLGHAPPTTVQTWLERNIRMGFRPLSEPEARMVRVSLDEAKRVALSLPPQGYGTSGARFVWTKVGCAFLGYYKEPLMPRLGYVPPEFPAYLIQVIAPPASTKGWTNANVALVVINAETGARGTVYGYSAEPIVGGTCGALP